MLPKSVTIQVYNAMLETSTSEHAARMAAMDNATKNCKEMIHRPDPGLQQGPAGGGHRGALDIVGGSRGSQDSRRK